MMKYLKENAIFFFIGAGLCVLGYSIVTIEYWVFGIGCVLLIALREKE